MRSHLRVRACKHLCVRAPSPPSHLHEASRAASEEDMRVAGRLGPPLLVGSRCERQQRVAVDPEQHGVDHGYACNGEAHSLEKAQKL